MFCETRVAFWPNFLLALFRGWNATFLLYIFFSSSAFVLSPVINGSWRTASTCFFFVFRCVEPFWATPVSGSPCGSFPPQKRLMRCKNWSGPPSHPKQMATALRRTTRQSLLVIWGCWDCWGCCWCCCCCSTLGLFAWCVSLSNAKAHFRCFSNPPFDEQGLNYDCSRRGDHAWLPSPPDDWCTMPDVRRPTPDARPPPSTVTFAPSPSPTPRIPFFSHFNSLAM